MVLVVGFSAIIYAMEPRHLSWEIDRRDTVPSCQGVWFTQRNGTMMVAQVCYLSAQKN